MRVQAAPKPEFDSAMRFAPNIDVMIDADRLQERIRELAKEIERDFVDRDLVCIGVLKGCFPFLADLVRHVDLPLEVDFLGLSNGWFGHPLEGENLKCLLIQDYTFYENGLFWKAKTWFDQYGFFAILLAALTPIPYKVFTISAGVFGEGIGTLLLGSLLGRTARFFGLAVLIYFFGPPVKKFIDQYFNILSILFAVLLIGGFVLIGKLL